MNVYVASSWRNRYQPEVVTRLRAAGHSVYDFRNPNNGQTGFSWSSIDSGWEHWSLSEYRRALSHETAKHGFERDFSALRWCDVCVLVLPSGASAHLEAGWCIGSGKIVIVFAPELPGPELMYKLFEFGDGLPIYERFEEVVEQLNAIEASR